MGYFLLRRTVGFVLTLLTITVVVFAVMNVLPGDPALTILGIEASEAALQALRVQLGLDQPLIVRYFSWIGAALTGDLGLSHAYRVSVTELVMERLPLTLSLAVGGMALTILLALAMGVGAAANHRRAGDWGVMFLSQIGIAVPSFWAAMLLVLLFAVHLQWLPPGGFPGWSDPGAALRSLILPVAALTFVQAAVLARVTRSAALEVMRLDYVRTARAMGYPRQRILWRHVLPNALVPIVTIVGLQFATLITGTIVIENVFYLPGLGRLVFQAIANRDLPLVQALVTLFAVIVVTVNFLVDVVYVMIDPRLKARA